MITTGRDPLEVPSTAEWGRALRTLRKLGVGKWDDHYEPDQPVEDGTHWSIEIESRGLVVCSWGDNAYPPKFNAALAAIRTLLREREFGWAR